jgi:hypothetical protein
VKIAQTAGDGFSNVSIALMLLSRIPQTAMNGFEPKNELVHRDFRHDRDHERQHLRHVLISDQFRVADAMIHPT